MDRPMRIAITGAAGQIGYALAFRIAAGALFGEEQQVCLSLLDTPPQMRALLGIQLELKDCAFPLLSGVDLSDDPDSAFADADWIVMLAHRQPESSVHSRLDLLRENGPIYVEHGQAMERVAKAARVLVVAEPCNTNCLIALSQAASIPVKHFFALNRLDRMRATSLIAEKAQVSVSKVNRVIVWGNRSERIHVDFHNAFIGDEPAHRVIQDPLWVRDVLQPVVAHRNRQIYELRSAYPAAAATQAILGTIRSITTPTPFLRRFGAGVFSDASYSIPHGLIFGFPLRTEDGRTWSIVEGLFLDEEAQQRLEDNVSELEHEAAVAGL